MKRVVLLIVAMIFSASISAQTMPTVNTDDVKNAGVAVAAEQSPEVEKQIKDALMKDEGLQKETINYLKENPETTNALSKILVDNICDMGINTVIWNGTNDVGKQVSTGVYFYKLIVDRKTIKTKKMLLLK